MVAGLLIDLFVYLFDWRFYAVHVYYLMIDWFVGYLWVAVFQFALHSTYYYIFTLIPWMVAGSLHTPPTMLLVDAE